MKNLFLFLAFSLTFCLFSQDTFAQSSKISIQGVLKDSDGAAVEDGDVDVEFKIYDALTDGALIWSEDAVVTVKGGVYSHLLGSVVSFAPGDLDGTRYLALKIGNAELAPRTEMTAAPSAAAAATATLAATATTALSADNALKIEENGGKASYDANGNLTIEHSGTDLIEVGKNNTTNFIKLLPNSTSTPTVDIVIGDHNTGINYKGSDHIAIQAGNSEVFHVKYVDGLARVGIQNNNPRTNFHVGSNGSRDGTGAGEYFLTGDGNGLANGSNWYDVVAYFEGGVVAERSFISTGSFVFSDERIKKNIELSNAQNDLKTLSEIKVSDYEHIDEKGSDKLAAKKVIAQQVKEVYPSAVSMIQQVIPNVYESTKQVSFENGLMTITTQKKHDFTIGDKVDIFTRTRDYSDIKVLAVNNDNTFVIQADEAVEQVFVYGKYVDDFHVVDYDAISMLNVSATQELHRQIQELQKENAALKAENAALGTQSDVFDSRLAKLEAMLKVSSTSTAVGGATDK